MKQVVCAGFMIGFSVCVASVLADRPALSIPCMLTFFFGALLCLGLAVSRHQGVGQTLELFGARWLELCVCGSSSIYLANVLRLCSDAPDQAIWAFAVQSLLAAVYLQLSGVGSIGAARDKAVDPAPSSEQERHRAEISAEQRLNHVIKGRCGSAISAIGLYRSMLTPKVKRGIPDGADQLLLDTMTHLQEAIEWCHRRQVFVQLEKGTYVSRPSVVRLRELLQSRLTKSDQLSCSVDKPLALDETVLQIALDEILSNALKCRKAGSSLTIVAWLAEGMLQVDVTNTNSSRAVLLTLKERESVFLPEYKSRSSSAMSDGLGLDSVQKAVAAVHGSASLWQDKRSTRVSFWMPAALHVPPVDEDLELSELSECSSTMPLLPSGRPAINGFPSSDAGEFESEGGDSSLPEELSTLKLDRDALLESSGLSSLPCLSGRLPSVKEGSAPILPARRLSLSPAGPTPDGAPAAARQCSHEPMPTEVTSLAEPALLPKCVGHATCCVQAAFLRELFLELDASQIDVFGASSAECKGVTDVVLGRHGQKQPGVDVIGHADVVVLSQRMGVGGEGDAIDGAKMAQELRMLGFEGVMCLHMPGASEEELAKARMHPAVDLLIPGSSPELHLRNAAYGILALLRHRLQLKGPTWSEGLTGTSLTGELGSVSQASRMSALHMWSSSNQQLTHASDSLDTSFYTGPGLASMSVELAEPAGPCSWEPAVARPGSTARRPSPPAQPPSAGLRVLGLDDENIPRMIQAMFIKHHLQADMGTSATLGKNDEEIAGFVDVAMGLLNNDLTPNTGRQRQADVVLLDENIRPPKILGSLLAAELRHRGFTGVIVVLTGASASMIAHLNSLPSIDTVYEKGAPLPKMAGEVRELLLACGLATLAERPSHGEPAAGML